jgi:diacylglycerol O-acyltransferase / wax synthase
VAIGCFAIYPVMPPRLLPGLIPGGFVDTVTQGHTVGSWGSPLVSHANQLAAMPSLHVGWATWVLLKVWAATTRRSLRAAATTHLAITVVVVIATANHFTLDVLAGAVVALMAARLSLPARSPVPDRELALTA